MTDDTISTDPKRLAEARQAAAEAALPKPCFDPKAVAREEYERVVLPYLQEGKPFEDAWKDFGTISEDFKKGGGAVLGVLSEQEYRQCVSSLYHRLNQFQLLTMATSQDERSQVLAKAAMYGACDRLKIDGSKTSCSVDPFLGVMRTAGKTTCLFHPNGCPDGASGSGNVLGDLLARIRANAGVK